MKDLPKYVEKFTRNHMKTVILPQINATLLKTLEHKIRKTFAQYVIPRIEAAVKENLEKHTSTNLRTCLGESLKEHFSTNLAPAFEKACQEIFRQMSETFSRGLEDYQNQLAETTALVGKSVGNQSSAAEVAAAVANLVKVAEKMNETIVVTQAKILRDFQESTQHTEDSQKDQNSELDDSKTNPFPKQKTKTKIKAKKTKTKH